MSVDFSVLGPLMVTVEGVTVVLSAPKLRAVVAALLVETNRVVSLDRLVDLVWPGVPPSRAVASLYAYVSQLRRMFEPHRQQWGPSTVLVSSPPGYVLRVGDGRLDGARFETSLAAGTAALRQGRPDEAAAVLDRGLALWRGRAFGELADEPFARAEAARLNELRLVGIELRVEAKLALGDHRALVPELEALVAEHPLRERFWANLMVALYRCDRHADALRAYQRCRVVLAEISGLDPSPALQGIEADVLCRSPSLDWAPPRDRAPGSGSHLVGGRPGHLTVEPAPVTPTMIGRQSEIAHLARAWAAAKLGRGGVTLIAGEAGIGKTTMVEEVARRIAADGGLVLWGRGHDGGGSPAYWAWSQVIADLVSRCVPQCDALMADAGIVRSHLGPLVPEWAVVGAPPADVERVAFQLHQNTTALLSAAAVRTPVAVILDDLHWMDASSLRLLELAAQRVAAARLLLIGTYRDDEIGHAHPLASTLGALARLPVTCRLTLHRFTIAEVRTYLSAVTEEPAGEALAAILHARTSGNPFFVAELVKMLVSEGSSADAEQIAAASVPVGVRDVIRRRLSRLPHETVASLCVASVIGEQFDIATVAGASELDHEGVEEALEPALVAGLIEDSGRPGALQFSHALIRETLYQGLSTVRRTRVHARTADALASDPAADTVTVAHHSLEATTVLAPDVVVRRVVAGAAVAASRLGFQQAQDLLTRAGCWLGGLAETPDTLSFRSSIQDHLALLLAATRGLAVAESEAAWQRSRELHLRSGRTRGLLAPVGGLSMVKLFQGRLEDAANLAGQLVRAGVDGHDDLVRLVGYSRLGAVDVWRGNISAARRSLHHARSLMSRVTDMELDSVLPYHPGSSWRTNLALASWFAADPSWVRWRREAVELQHRLPPGLFLAQALFMDLSLAVCSGVSSGAGLVDQAAEVAERADALGFPWMATFAKASMFWAIQQRGSTDVTAEMTREVETYVTEAHEGRVIRIGSAICLGQLCEVHRIAGDKDQALVAVDRALVEILGSGARVIEPELLRLRGELLAPIEPHAARQSLSRAIELARSQGSKTYLGRAQQSLRDLS